MYMCLLNFPLCEKINKKGCLEISVNIICDYCKTLRVLVSKLPLISEHFN